VIVAAADFFQFNTLDLVPADANPAAVIVAVPPSIGELFVTASVAIPLASV